MPITTYEKAHTPRALVYDSLHTVDFDTQTLVINQVITNVQAFYPLPVAVKIYGASIVAGSASNGVTAFNVVMGLGGAVAVAPSDNSEAQGYPSVTAVNGSILFAANQAVTLVAGVPQLFAADVPDAIWPKGALLTLRYTTGGAIAGLVKVSLLAKAFDNTPMATTKANRPVIFADM